MKDYFTSLQSDHPLFQRLRKDNPIWWQFVKKNLKPGGFYVDIRKDNSLNVYYNGGLLLKITLKNGIITSKIHAQYLGDTGSGYVDYQLDRLPEEADTIKARITSRYGDTSESGIKARLICTNGAKYIDSEFAYGKTRIDLTKLENGKIIFVELKRIQDGRLLTNEYENGRPEILSQMKAYHQFIEAHKKEITGYYRRLFMAKRDLGVLPECLSEIDNIDDYELCENVELYIDKVSYDSHPTAKRERRINAIKTILNNNGIVHNL